MIPWVSYQVQCSTKGRDAGLNQLSITQQVTQDLYNPVSPQKDSLSPQSLQLLSVHILVHPRQRCKRSFRWMQGKDRVMLFSHHS